jgi:hypothetical protein
MRPERRAPALRPLRTILACWDQLRLDLKVVTGGRAPVLAIVTLLWFVVFALFARFRDDPWDPEAYFNLMLVFPGSILAIALGMVVVMADRDTRQLEVTFVSPSGRYRAWVFRLVAVTLACIGSALVLSLATWLIVDRGHEPWRAALHAWPPLAFTVSLTVFLSVLFRGTAVAGLGASVVLGASGLLREGIGRVDYWFNPFAMPGGLEDPQAWFRAIVFNRTLYVGLAALLAYGALALLQRRERLL